MRGPHSFSYALILLIAAGICLGAFSYAVGGAQIVLVVLIAFFLSFTTVLFGQELWAWGRRRSWFRRG